MKCCCNTCKHCFEHSEGLWCEDKLTFVHKEDMCYNWDSDEVLASGKFVSLAIIAIGIVLLLAKFL